MSKLLEDLRKWFDKNHPDGGWKRINSKGEAIGPCAREPGEPKPKCMSNKKRAQLSKKERASAVRSKRTHDPDPERKGKPINVSNFGKGKISEMTDINEENKPTNSKLWARAKALARQKFDVYPSAYANGWAAKWYKSKGGGWKSVKEDVTSEACWNGYKQEGMKKKGKRMVPNCVPEERSKLFNAIKKIVQENVYECSEDCGCEMNKRKMKYKKSVKEDVEIDEAKSPAWQRKEGKNPEGGLNRKGVEAYRRDNPGSKLQTAVTTKPSKLKKGSKAAKRRKSFCSRMKGMKAKLTSAKTARDPDSRINKSLRKWNC